MSGLNNADFRQFVSNRVRPQYDEIEKNDFLTLVEKPKRKKPSSGSKRYRKYGDRKKYYSKVNKNEKDEDDEKKVKYRDRAKEMREGSNVDYQDNEISFESMDMETSKFLGGDIQHTHMVKGLDYILLNRVRGDIDEKADEDLEKNLKKKKNDVSKKVNRFEKVKFSSVIGRRIHQILFPEDISVGGIVRERKMEAFFPGRMLFEFDLDPRESENMPTILMRSKEDCPHFEDVVSGKVSDALVNDIRRLIQVKKRGGHHRSHKKDKASIPQEYCEAGYKKSSKSSISQAPSPEVEEEEDIFEGVGTYLFQSEAKSHEKKKISLVRDEVISVINMNEIDKIIK